LSLTPFAPSRGSEWNQSLDASELRAVAANSHVWARWDDGWVINFRRLR
jgi:hypothetical protein